MRLAGLVVAGSLLLVACGGGGDEGGDEGGETGGDEGGATTFTVDAKEFQFTPSTLTVPADQEITVEVVNSGAVEHDVTLDEASVKIAPPATETATGTFSVSAGTYTFYCSVPGHREAGMEGTLTAS
jgi:plastocyanin